MRKWKVCPQNRNYKISNDGLCMSNQANYDGHFLKPAYRLDAEYYVLCKSYYKKAYPIKHLVYTAFVGKVPKGYIVTQKDGDRYNYNVENLFVMPRGDKIFYCCERKKKLPRMRQTYTCTFVINGKTYSNSAEVLKDYPCIGTRQNLLEQANRWVKGIAPKGKTWNAKGFTIKGLLVWVSKERKANPTKIRMDTILKKYSLTKDKNNESC